jgi:hypothetical protein
LPGRSHRPEPIRRPIADWVERMWETYPDRFYFGATLLPALPFLLMAGIPFARAYAGELVAAAVLMVGVGVVVRLLDGRAARRAAERLRHHTCLECGYDLRATPYVCPECGAFAKPPPGWRPPPELATPQAGESRE